MKSFLAILWNLAVTVLFILLLVPALFLGSRYFINLTKRSNKKIHFFAFSFGETKSQNI